MLLSIVFALCVGATNTFDVCIMLRFCTACWSLTPADYRSPKQYLSSNERSSKQVVDDFNFELELAHAMQQNPQQWA
jgi:hypothetical protein